MADDHEQDEASVSTLIGRMTSALGEEKARSWIEAGRVVVDGEIASDPDQPTPFGVRWLISGG